MTSCGTSTKPWRNHNNDALLGNALAVGRTASGSGPRGTGIPVYVVRCQLVARADELPDPGDGNRHDIAGAAADAVATARVFPGLPRLRWADGMGAVAAIRLGPRPLSAVRAAAD